MIAYIRRRFKVACLIGAAIVVLGGCSPAVVPEAPPWEPTDEPTTEATVDPQTPSPTEAGWLISSAGIGPYKLGEAYEPEIDTIYTSGCSLRVFEDELHGAIALHDRSVGTWHPVDEPPVDVLHATIVMTYFWGEHKVSLPPRTAEGIGIGSTREEVMAAYPDAEVKDTRGRDPLTIVRDGVPITFEFPHPDDPDSDRVMNVYVGVESAPHEFCA